MASRGDNPGIPHIGQAVHIQKAHLLFPFQGFSDHRHDLIIGVRAHTGIHLRDLFHDLLPVPLGQAACYNQGL